MSINNLSSLDISRRFMDEQGYIQRYVTFLRAQISTSDFVLREVSSILERYGLSAMAPDHPWSLTKESLLLADDERLLSHFRKLLPAIAGAVEETQKHVDSLKRPKTLDNGDLPDEVDEWARYFIEALKDDHSPDLIQAVRQQALDKLDQEAAESTTSAQSLGENAIEEAILAALYFLSAKKLDDLTLVQEIIEDLELSMQIKMPQTQINVLRHGFLLLMTAFDAAVFDLVRMVLKDNFFPLVGHFAKPEKISLQSLASYKSFSSFRDDIIETQLKSRYLKDLLLLLDKLDAPIVDRSSADSFPRLIELVLRRNIHVHNRGIVDERYLERDEQGRPRFNIYALNVGEPAIIDPEYWQTANSLSEYTVTHLANWSISG
jgi:hypothetical protein